MSGTFSEAGGDYDVGHRDVRQLTPAEVSNWFDLDGRLVKEAAMRKGLYEAGIHPSCRRQIFKFLFGIYPMNATTSDQKAIDVDNRAHYLALRRRWEVLDKTITFPDDDVIEPTQWYMETSDNECEEDDSNSSPSSISHSPTDRELISNARATDMCRSCGKSFDIKNAVKNEMGEHRSYGDDGRTDVCVECSVRVEDCAAGDAVRNGAAPATYSNGCGLCRGEKRRRRCSSSGVLDPEGVAMLQILEFPSRVFATRLPVDLEKSYPQAKRTILRDVSRTDRSCHFFSHKRNLRKVHRILLIYALFHPDMGYAQGMNDLLARFLVVTSSEVDSYWLFKHYMDSKRDDFLEETMMIKVGLVKNLIMEINTDLYSFFEKSECSDYLFCHRWLLLDFKREFPLEESVRIFEVLSSHYLELNSDKALVETDKVIAKEFELDGGEMRAKRSLVNPGFTFDLFVCAAILVMNSSAICAGNDAASVYGCLSSLSMKMQLESVLKKAEQLFYKYCRLSVIRGFSEIQT